MAVTSGCVALCVAAAIGGTTVAIGALGFGAAGVAAGSAAAWYQSVFLGGAIAKGSIFATLQSVGAAGVAKTTYAALVATCTAACTAGITVCVAVCNATGFVGTTNVIAGLGFGPLGPVAGSIATWIQRTVYAGATGGLFAALQRIGMAGLGAKAKAAIVAACTAACTAALS